MAQQHLSLLLLPGNTLPACPAASLHFLICPRLALSLPRIHVLALALARMELEMVN